MFDFEAQVLIGWLANTLASQSEGVPQKNAKKCQTRQKNVQKCQNKNFTGHSELRSSAFTPQTHCFKSHAFFLF